MNLRQKTFLSSLIAFIILVVILLIAFYTIVLNSFEKLEVNLMENHLTQMEQAIEDEKTYLHRIALDYSGWRDTADFVKNRDKKYLEVNFLSNHLENLNLQLYAFFDNKQQLIEGATYYSKTRQKISLASMNTNQLQLFLQSKGETKLPYAGLINIADSAYLFAAYPIKAEKTTESYGTLLLGRRLDNDTLREIGKVTQLKLELHWLNSSIPLNEDFNIAYHSILEKNSISNTFIRPLNSKNIAGYLLLRDLDEHPSTLIRINMPRSVYEQGQLSVSYLIIFALLTTIVLTVIILIAVDRFVLTPIALLSYEVSRVGTMDDTNENPQKVTVPKQQDEISYLADCINTMLSALRNSNSQLTQALEENRQLIDRNTAVQEQERRRLAREFHDEFGQSIIAIQAETRAITVIAKQNDNYQHRFDKIAESAGSIINITSQMYEALHVIISQLRPPTLDELGLRDTLQETLNNWQQRFNNIDCQFEAIGQCDNLSHLNDEINITIYRVLQECLNNIAKHSLATKVTVFLWCQPNTHLTLQVTDNGKGIEATQIKRGLGLLGMRERARALNGELTIESEEQQGVCITLRVPLNRPDALKNELDLTPLFSENSEN